MFYCETWRASWSCPGDSRRIQRSSWCTIDASGSLIGFGSRRIPKEWNLEDLATWRQKFWWNHSQDITFLKVHVYCQSNRQGKWYDKLVNSSWLRVCWVVGRLALYCWLPNASHRLAQQWYFHPKGWERVVRWLCRQWGRLQRNLSKSIPRDIRGRKHACHRKHPKTKRFDKSSGTKTYCRNHYFSWILRRLDPSRSWSTYKWLLLFLRLHWL